MQKLSHFFCYFAVEKLQKKNMKKIIIAIAIVTAICSCGEPQPDIPEDKFAEIIFQMHRADAILNVKGLSDNALKNDSLSYYNDVFIKEGITRKQFMEAIDWYIHHPKQYKDLYDKVIKKVSQMEQDEAKRYEVKADRDTNDIWNMRSDWNLPLDGETNPIAFNIDAKKNGTYTLTCDVTYYEDDLSDNPRTTLIAVYTDNTTDENSVYGVVKDGKERQVSVMLKTNPNKQVKQLKGWVLDHSNETIKKHIDCYNIQLKYTNE